MSEGGKVVIVGGGGGGAIAANLLAGKFDVTVIDRSEYHYFQPGNLFIAFQGKSPTLYRRRIADLLKPRVDFVHDEAASIDLDEREVVTASGRELNYDRLIIAAGVHLDYSALENHEALLNAFGDYYHTQEMAVKLHESLRGLKSGTFVIAVADPIYKCPPGPLKAAFLSRELLNRMGRSSSVKVVLAVPFPHAYPSKTVSDIVEPELEARGIEVRTIFTADQIDLEERKIVSLEGEELKFDVATVVPPNEGPRIEISPEGVRDGSGFVKIDKFTSQVEGYDDAFAIGDCTNAPTSKSGVTAHLQAETVAKRIMGMDARYTGRTNCPIILDGLGTFVISDYEHPPVPVRLSKFKRFMEDLFVAAYWSSIRNPGFWGPVFEAYFRATEPEVLERLGGW